MAAHVVHDVDGGAPREGALVGAVGIVGLTPRADAQEPCGGRERPRRVQQPSGAEEPSRSQQKGDSRWT